MWYSFYCLLFAFSLTVGHALAQEATETTETSAEAGQGQATAEGVVADLGLWSLQPVLDEAGQPVIGVDGQPVEEFQPVAEGMALLPGDEIRYVLTLTNEGGSAEDIALALDLPAEALLLPETVSASVDATFELGSSEDPALREPIMMEVDGATIPNPAWTAAPERFDLLHTTIDRLATEEAATVTYDLVVR